jgi:tetratricopeptide (TPR) repeat protein
MVYFSDRRYTPKTSTEARQWASVLDFRDEMPREQLWWNYSTPLDFERLLREHLVRYLEHARSPTSETLPRATIGESVRFNVPAVAASFTGREHELALLDAELGEDDPAVVTIGISGLGGVGKSQLAARYTHLHAVEYDLVAWIAAEDGGTADLAKLADALSDDVDEALAPSERAQLALELLAGTSRRWLLVLDNVQSPQQLEGLRPAGGHGRVLVTTRDRDLSQFGRLIALDVFDEDTATEYLADRAGRGDDPAARRLAGALGYLPLALSHAAAYCQHGTSFSDYHELLDPLPAEEFFASQPELSYQQTVASTWQTSIQAAASTAPLANGVLEMAAYLAPDAIPKTLFAGLRGDDTPRARRRLTDAFGALARYCLATVTDDRISLHPLLQKTVRDAVAARGDRVPGLRALQAVDERFPRDTQLELPREWPLCEQLMVHVDALAHTLPQEDEDELLVRLLNRASAYLYRAKGGRRGLATAETALERADELLDADHPDTLNARNNLGLAYEALGRIPEALAIFEPLLPQRERILGPAHPDTLQTRHNLAGAYQESGQAEKAVELFEQLLEERQAILGAEHSHTLRTRNGLANAYLDAGRPADAITNYVPVLADRERVLGASHPSTLNTRHGLATAYRDAGRIAEAIAIYEPLLAIQKDILGAEHHNTLQTRFSLAATYLKAGRSPEGIATYELLLADCLRIFGAEDTHTLSVRESLIDAYEAVGGTDDARELRDPRWAKSRL